MANTPKKIMKDPTEAALSAIQDALNVRDPSPASEPATPPERPSMPADESGSDRSWRGASAGTPASNALPDDEVRRPEDAGSVRRPANDDRESIGQILRSLQRR